MFGIKKNNKVSEKNVNNKVSEKKANNMSKIICCTFLALLLVVTYTTKVNGSSLKNSKYDLSNQFIRFHVIANSDEDKDQQLKYAVRDVILKRSAPILAESSSLEESRKILKELEPELIKDAEKVVKDWGEDYPVVFDYGVFAFPSKSYGNIVLPAGEYEAVKIKIGKAEGANWWCVLFPPLCFVNIEKSTSIEVDGKKAVPIDYCSPKNYDVNQNAKINLEQTLEMINVAELDINKNKQKENSEKFDFFFLKLMK